MAGQQVDSSLDLSHLTEEEQSSILQVLQRNLELRHRDEGRIRILEQTEPDPSRLRLLSGEWFSQVCGKRHRKWTSGCDLIQASLRHRKTKSKDVHLNEVFSGEEEEETFQRNVSPEAEEIPQDNKEKESGGCRESLKPEATPSRNPVEQSLQHRNRSSPSKERRCNGYSEEPEVIAVTHPHYIFCVCVCVCVLQLGGSMMSLFSSGDFGVVEVRGRIQYSLVYDTHKEELQVKVYRCEDIASARKNRSDPYVKSYLLPDKSNHSKKKTPVKKKTLNPVYDQMLRYKVGVRELHSRTLNLSVWHAENLGKNVFLGEVEVPLGLWDWTCTQPLWQDLQPRVRLCPDSVSCRGSIFFSIKFIPDGFEGGGLPLTGEIHIWLQEAQGLLSNKGGTIDSFIRSYILPDASRQSGQKTRVAKRSVSPTYNHTMVYDGFHTSDLREACAELTVCQRDGLKTHVLGGIRLSCGTGQSYGATVSWMDSTEEEVAVWTSMIENPNHWIEATLPVRTNLTQRSV
ncbi:synaptotagmin-like protein 1 [Austrofundulus limnaeus]|uniref:Synaptotagmin-like protein 1 n=1 Tax=Austrofundulus limnaeus TaxID=52670 RepID=A0A2I4B029_AUSLI|nr:PREDICTED: synaptotagmin-like protein 1 [Austrofundulus limnaeus]